MRSSPLPLCALLLAGCGPVEDAVAPPQAPVEAPAPPPPTVPPVAQPRPAEAPPARQEPRVFAPPTADDLRWALDISMRPCVFEHPIAHDAYLEVLASVKPTGRVDELQVVTNTLSDPALLTCLRDQIARVTFPPFRLPPTPKGRPVSCPDGLLGDFDCKALPYDALTVPAALVIAPSGASARLAEVPSEELYVDLFASDLRWPPSKEGLPQACIERGGGRGWCFTLAGCAGANSYVGLRSPRGGRADVCGKAPLDRPSRVRLIDALDGMAIEQVKRSRR